MKRSTLLQYHDLIAAIISALEERDIYTECHSMRVADMSQMICKLMNLSDEISQTIHIAAHLHDVGKIGIDDAVLRKEKALTESEWEKIKCHSVIGYKILHKINTFSAISIIVLHHHERFDGKGYPSRIKGNEIPLGSRIIAVADSIDAMMSKRCYRNSLSSSECRLQIEINKGLMYDPQIVDIVLSHWEEIVDARNDFDVSDTVDIDVLKTIWDS